MASTAPTLTPPLVLPPAIRRVILAHAHRVQPDECCGLLVGRGSTCWAAMPVENVARDRRRRFEVDPRAHIALRRALRSVRPALEIVGVYHSHPSTAPTPSPTDVAEAHYPAWLYVVVGIAGRRRQIRAYRLREGRFVAVPIATRSLQRR